MKPITALAFAIAIPMFVAPLACGDSKFSDAEEKRREEEATNAAAAADAGAEADVIEIKGAPPGCNGEALPKDDPCVIDEGLGVFVSSTLGTIDGDGTRAKPFKTLQKAIDFAQGVKKRVYACAEVFGEGVVLADGVSLFGGFDCINGVWSVGAKRATIRAPSPALKGAKLGSALRVDSFVIESIDAATPGASSIAALISDSDGELRFANSRIVSGRGASGASLGAQPPTLVNSVNMKGGQNNYYGKCTNPNQNLCLLTFAPGQGGSNDCGSGYKGGNGGRGGYGGRVRRAGGVNTSSEAPEPGGGGTAETASGGGYSGPVAKSGVTPPAASDGTSSQGGTFTSTGFIAGDGTRGADGAPGQGGGGGAGELVPVGILTADGYFFGSSGAGGGAGGCPGLAQPAGGGGGSSIAVYSWKANLIFEGTTVQAADAGNGAPGALGLPPTEGGDNGVDVVAGFYTSGGEGSRGGLAGTSGHGAGGSSLGVAYKGNAPALGTTVPTVGLAGAGRPAQNGELQVGAFKYARAIPASANGVASAVHPIP